MGDVLPFPPDPALRQTRARFEAEARRLSERLDQLRLPQVFGEIAMGQLDPPDDEGAA